MNTDTLQTTREITVAFTDEHGAPINPDHVVATITDTGGRTLATLTAGTDAAWVTHGSPTGTYKLVYTPTVKTRLTCRVQATWTRGDGQPGYQAAETTWQTI